MIKQVLAAAAVLVAVTAAAKLHGRSLHKRDRQLRQQAEIEERIQHDWRR